jgi:1,5-anhydro-D-fructose reductase (1,5-anhydro-D-mannitol-forming)
MNVKPVERPVNMGVIGYGHYMRTNFVRRLRKCSSLNLVGVYNRGEDRRKQAEQDGFWATGDLDELLARPGLEAVLIGTSNAAHKEQAIRAAQAGKHVLCEKPLALNLADIDEMVAAVEKADVINHVNHPGPYGESFIQFQNICQEYAGEILHYWNRSTRAFGTWVQGARHVAVAHPEDSGGWTMHHFCHQLNDACILLNTNKAVKVYHVMQKSCAEAPSEELVNSLLTFDTGATAFLSDGTTIGPFLDVGVHGSKADIRWLDNKIYVARPGPSDPMQRPGNVSAIRKTFDVNPTQTDPHETIGHIFAQAVRGGPNNLLTFRFIRDQYRVLMGLKESAATGRVVDLRWDQPVAKK